MAEHTHYRQFMVIADTPTTSDSAASEVGLFHGFEGYRSATQEDLIDAIQHSLVVLDTNVLLGLYNYQGTALADFMKVFDALGERLFVPHQVLDEFWRNRRTVLSQNQGKHREQSEIVKAFDEIERSFRKWFQRVVDRTGTPPPETLRELDEARAAIVEYMQERNNQANAPTADTPTHEDRILSALEPILHGRVGPAPSAEEHRALLQEAEKRGKAKIPPGYMDAEKNPERAAGDFLVWRQAMVHAKDQGLPVLMVTQDQKEDWWADRGTESMRARPELVTELQSFAGQHLLMVRAHQLAGLGEHLGVEISKSTLVEAAAATTTAEDIDWTEQMVRDYLDVLWEWHEHYAILEEATRAGGELGRARVAEIFGKDATSGLRGMRKPYYTALKRSGDFDGEDLEKLVPLLPIYEGSWMTALVMPKDFVLLFARIFDQYDEEGWNAQDEGVDE